MHDASKPDVRGVEAEDQQRGYFTAAAFLDPVPDDHAAQHWDPDRADWAPQSRDAAVVAIWLQFHVTSPHQRAP